MKFGRRQFGWMMVWIGLVSGVSYSVGQSPNVGHSASKASPATPLFPPLEQWKEAVVAGNVTALRALYSTEPMPQIATLTGPSSTDTEIAFWMGLKPHGMKISVVKSEPQQPGVQQVVFEAEIHSGVGSSDHVQYVTEAQLWQQQGASWKVIASKRTDATRLEQPASTDKVIYAPGLDAHEEIKQALAQAAKQHKNVLIVFGANWCYDCHVLDLAFHRPDLAGVLSRNYEVVHVDVGEGDKNQDIMLQYHVPMKKGIPALAVLDASGKLLYSQQGGEFEKARSLAPEDLLVFLNKWKPTKQGAS
ncbi:MAG: thioredoxin family protein [Candidatus Korobacteraceae bacterium]